VPSNCTQAQSVNAANLFDGKTWKIRATNGSGVSVSGGSPGALAVAALLTGRIMSLAATTEVKPAIEPKESWLDPWHVNPAVNRDYDFIDGLRGIAILMVIACHHFYINPKSGHILHTIGSLVGTGSHGVTLFFALSGFLISWPFWKSKVAGAGKVVPRGYAQRRFWKIYPPLALSVLILTPFYILVYSDPSYFPIGLKWLAGWGFIVPISGKFNPVMWTLIVEVQFYVTIPLLFLCLKRLSPKATLAVVTAILFLAPMLMRVLTGKVVTLQPNIEVHYPSMLDTFCLGVLIAGLDNMGFIRKSWVGWGVAGIFLWPLALVTFSWFSMHPQDKSVFTNELVGWGVKFWAASLLLFIAQPEHFIAKILCAPWLRWCGIISYEWYILHQPLALGARHVFGPANGNFIKYALIVIGPIFVSLIVSAAAYRFFSLPILRYGRGRARR